MDNTPATANAKASERDSHLLARRLELATETAGIGIYEAELATGWAFYSEGFLRNLGYGSGDWRASQEEWFARLHPDERAILEEAYLAVQDGSLRSLEYRMRHRDGSYRWFLGHGKGIDLDAQGRARRIVGLCIDITERRQAECQLQATRQQLELERAELRATLDALIEPHVLLAPVRDASGAIVDFQYQDANPAACTDNRLSREQLLGRSLLDLLPAHMATGLIHHYTEAMESGTPLILNDYVYPNDLFGEERRYDIRAVRVGNRLSYSWRDVTERYRSATQLRESEQRYRLLAENSTDVVVHLRDARIVWVSPSLTAALGWDPQDWIGQPGDAFLDPRHRDTLVRKVAAIAQGHPISHRHRIRAKDGSWHWMDTKAQTFLDGEGQPDGLLATGRLVDAEVAASQALERKSAELASKLRTSLTAAVVAHEINQPLSVILLQAQLALEAARRIGAAADPLQAALASLIAEGDQVVATIERMRMLLRNVETPLEPLDLALVVNNAVLYVQTQVSQQAVDLRWQPPPQPLPVAGDAVQLQRAIANLIRNSLEALAQPAAASAGRIVLSATRLADGVELRVADNGPGFGDLQLEDLPLTTSKHQGMGLGLFVVQTTITNHGGTMALGRSALGGAEVLLRLPLLKV